MNLERKSETVQKGINLYEQCTFAGAIDCLTMNEGLFRDLSWEHDVGEEAARANLVRVAISLTSRIATDRWHTTTSESPSIRTSVLLYRPAMYDQLMEPITTNGFTFMGRSMGEDFDNLRALEEYAEIALGNRDYKNVEIISNIARQLPNSLTPHSPLWFLYINELLTQVESSQLSDSELEAAYLGTLPQNSSFPLYDVWITTTIEQEEQIPGASTRDFPRNSGPIIPLSVKRRSGISIHR